MNSKIPTVRFTEEDATRLIASFGKKIEPEKQLDLQAMLKEHKEKFLANEHSREATKNKNRD